VRYVSEIPDKRTINMDRLHLRQLDPFLREKRLNEINMEVLWSFIHARRERDGVANATVNRALEIVRRVLNLAHQEWGWLDRVPRIRMLKEPKRRIRFLTREDADRLHEALPEHLRPVVQCALATGCRMSEILHLEWTRVDFDRRVAWLDPGTTKNGEGRGITLNNDAVLALSRGSGGPPALVLCVPGRADAGGGLGVGAIPQACRNRGPSVPRSAAHVGELARQERHELAGAHGVGRLEVVRDGASLRALGARAPVGGGPADRAGLGRRRGSTLRFPYAGEISGARTRVNRCVLSGAQVTGHTGPLCQGSCRFKLETSGAT
jgi:hypothetical protein